MSEDLFQPTLKSNELNVIESYNIHSLLYVGFFGGTLAVLLLGTINALWLKVEKRHIFTVIGIGVFFVVAKLVWAGYMLQGVDIQSIPIIKVVREFRNELSIAKRAAGAVTYLIFSYFMKSRFNQFTLNGGVPKSMWGTGIASALIIGTVENVITFYGGALVSRFF